MGAHFALSIHEGVPWPQLAQRAQIRCLGSRVRDARPIWEVDLRSPSIWLFGNEGGGLDPQIEDSKVEWVRIPQSAGMESLNVAAAAAICLFEQSRQRNRA
jgi:TrmH family RNA methyltransferase